MQVDYEMLQPWRKLMERLSRITELANVELVGLLTEVNQLQTELILTDKLLGMSPKAVEYYLGTLSPQLAKLLPTRTQGGCEAPLNQCLHNCLATYLKYGHLSQYRLYDVLDPLFGSQQKWYSLNPATFEEPLNLQADEEFLRSLKVDDLVDVVMYREQKQGHWLPGRITMVGHNFVKVVFEDGYSETVQLGWRVQPLASRCADWEWRKQLKKQDIVDACDSVGVWITSTVIEVEKDMKVEIGFRVESSVSQDSLEFYTGWSPKFDVTMSVFDPRIQRANTRAKKFCKSASKKDGERTIEDVNDLLLLKEHKQKPIYALQRDPLVAAVYFELIDEFGANRGFERLLEQLQNKETTPQETEALLNFLYRLSDRLSRMLIESFVPRLREIMWKSLVECSQSFVKKLTRECMQSMLFDIGTLMKRHYSIDQKKEWLQNLSLELAKRCLRSESLERKIQGLKCLEDHIKCLQNERNSYKDKQNFYEWLEQESLFEIIYGPQTHVELLSRSQQFFKYLAYSLPAQRLKQFWQSLAKQDVSHKDIMYKLMNQCSRKFRDVQIDVIIENLDLISAGDINEDLLELLYEFANREERQTKIVLLLWNKLLENGRDFRPKMKDRTTDKLNSIIRGMCWPSDTMSQLIADAIKRPLSKTMVIIMVASIGQCKHLPSQRIQAFIEYLVAGLQALPEKKYGYLDKLLELLIELEYVDCKLSSTVQQRIIDAVKPSGSIALLTFLTKRHSTRSVYPPVDCLTPESFKMVMDMFERSIRGNDEDPKQMPFFKYVISVLEQHQNAKVQELASQVIAALYIRSYQEVRQRYLSSFLEECLEKNSQPYYRVLRMLIEGIQTNWPYSTFANVASPSGEIQLTVMNDIIMCKDTSRSFVFKIGLNFSFRNLLLLLSNKTDLSMLDLRLTHNHHELRESDSIKTIAELGLKSSPILHLTRGSTSRRPLINPNSRKLTPAVRDIFTEAFKDNSTDGKMTKEEFSRYYQRYSYSSFSMDSYKLDRIFADRQHLLLEDFLKFEEKEADDSEHSLRLFIERMGYLPDLSKKSDPHQKDIATVPSTLLTRNPITYDQLFEAAANTNQPDCQKQIVTLLMRLPIRRSFFVGRAVEELIVQLAEQTNPYVMWYCFVVLKFIYRKEANSHYLDLDLSTVDDWYNQLNDNGVPLVVGCLKKIYALPRGSYILDTLLEDLLTMLHEMLLTKGRILYSPLEKLIPKFEDLKQPFFVPDHPKPDASLDVDLKWLMPKKEYTARINQLIYELLVMGIVLGDVSAWESASFQLEGYRFERMLQWCISLSLWRGSMPAGGLQQLLSNSKYELAAFIIRHYSASCDIDFSLLTKKLVEELLQYQPTEMRNLTTVDTKLVGLLSVLETIFQTKSPIAQQYDKLAQELLYGYLFPKDKTILPDRYVAEQPIKESVLCFSKESREKAYSIVACIAKNNPAQHDIILRTLIDKLTGSIPIPKKFERRSSPIRSTVGFVGLRNLGATCYMNAILQQMYCCEPLRKCIMSLKQPSTAFMNELQKLFTYLQFSERADFQPAEFFKHVKMAGVPAPTNVQQDAHEFLSFFHSEVELAFAKTPFANLIKQIYSGTLASQIICDGCGSINETPDNFSDIRLEVKEKTTLYESFEKLIQGEAIADYRCERCESKQTVHKRVLLDQLPNFLTLNLQRIIFDYDTFVNKKIHSKLEFPDIINLTAFTKGAMEEAKKRKQTQVEEEEVQRRHEHHSSTESHLYQYRLKGIVVHLGAAQAGHYYSLIRQAGKWISFDDSRISEFQDTIESECFGGTTTADDDWNKQVDYSKNAYVLLYERVHKQKFVLQNVKEQELEAIQPLLNKKYERTFEQDAVQLEESQLIQPVIDKYWLDVVKDNYLLLQQNMYLSEQLSSFVVELMGQLPHPHLPNDQPYFSGELPEQVVSLYEIGYRYLVYMVFDIGTQLEVDARLVCELSKLLKYLPSKALQLLKERLKIYYLLNCTKEFRMQMKFFYEMVLMACQHVNGGHFSPDVVSFLEGLLRELNGEVAKNWNKSYEYFDFLKDTMMNDTFRQFLVQRDIIGLLLDFLMDKDSPVHMPNSLEKKYQIGNSIQLYSLLPIVQVVFMALKSQYNLEDQATSWHVTPIAKLSENAKTLLQSQEVIKRLLRDRSTMEWVGCIICYNCYLNLEFSQKVARMVLIALGNSYSADDVLLYAHVTVTVMQTIKYYLSIVDKFTSDRMEMLLGFPQLNMNSEGSFALVSNVKASIFSYPSTLRIEQRPLRSILDLLCKEKIEYKPYAVCLMQLVLGLCIQYDHVFQYMIKLPPPTYMEAHYFEWMQRWISEFNLESYKHHKPQFNSKEIGDLVQREYNQVMVRLNKRIADSAEAINKTKRIFAEKRGAKYEEAVEEYGVSKSLGQPFVYGCTWRITQSVKKEIEPELFLLGYDYYVYRQVSRPTGTSNMVFPHYFYDLKGRISQYQLNTLPKLMKFVHTKPSEINGRVEIIEQEDPDAVISFQPIFSSTASKWNQKKDKKKVQEQLPVEFTTQVPPPQQSTILRVFFLVNHSTNRYQLKLRPIKVFMSNLPRQLHVPVPPKSIRLVLTSLEPHDMDVEIVEREKIEIVEEPQKVANPDADQKLFQDQVKSLEGLLSCPKCTYLNSIENMRCCMCDADMFGG